MDSGAGVCLAIATRTSLSSKSDYEKQGDTWYLEIIGQCVSYLFIKVLDADMVVTASFPKAEKLNMPEEAMFRYCKIFSRKLCSTVSRSRVRLVYRKKMEPMVWVTLIHTISPPTVFAGDS